jgi:SWI/SNF related-matrix-associated actin-dependent regulator of chromatin subfamily C
LNVSLGKLKEIVKRHQGLIAETEAEATHLVHSAADPLEEEYARPLFRRDRNTLLHWYTPVKATVLNP